MTFEFHIDESLAIQLPRSLGSYRYGSLVDWNEFWEFGLASQQRALMNC